MSKNNSTKPAVEKAPASQPPQPAPSQGIIENPLTSDEAFVPAVSEPHNLTAEEAAEKGLQEGQAIIVEPSPLPENEQFKADLQSRIDAAVALIMENGGAELLKPKVEEEDEAEEDDSALRLIGQDLIPDEVEEGRTFAAGFDKKLKAGAVITKKEHKFKVLAYMGDFENGKGKIARRHLIEHVPSEDEKLPIKASYFKGTFEEVEE